MGDAPCKQLKCWHRASRGRRIFKICRRRLSKWKAQRRHHEVFQEL